MTWEFCDHFLYCFWVIVPLYSIHIPDFDGPKTTIPILSHLTHVLVHDPAGLVSTDSVLLRNFTDSHRLKRTQHNIKHKLCQCFDS